MNARAVVLAGAVALACSAATAADLPGAADHPLLPRYEGAEIVRYHQQAFAYHRVLNKPAKAYGGQAKNLASTLPLEGKLTQITYRAPAQRSPLEVARNYQQAFKDGGFELLFSCEKEACGGRNFNHAAVASDIHLREHHQEQQYLLAKKSRPAQGDVYAAVYVVKHAGKSGPNAERALVQLEVVELKPLEHKMVVVDAPAMQRDLSTHGKVAVYGVLFDTDKDTMRADSKPQLDEIAKLLKGQPTLKVLVVGHTDAKGSMDHNRDLSLRRARSIVDALARDHGIDRQRLTPQGVGMAAPTASNRSEEGRALNRRVELVEVPN